MDSIQDLCSKTVGIILPDLAKEEFEKLILKSSSVREVVHSIVDDHIVDHYDEHHKPLVDISVLVAKVVGELTNKLSGIKKEA